MKHLTKKSIALAVPLILSTQGFAQEKPYFGVDYFAGNFTQSNADISPDGLRIKVGSDLHKYLALEVHFATTGEEEQEVTGGAKWDIKLDYLYGTYARGQFPLGNNRGSIYAIAGYSTFSFSSDSSSSALGNESVEEDASESGGSIGLGMDYAVYNNWLVNLDYTSYLNKDGYELNAFNIGVKYQLD